MAYGWGRVRGAPGLVTANVARPIAPALGARLSLSALIHLLPGAGGALSGYWSGDGASSE
ncbi:hypothetical protein CVO96_20005 [Deinococcus koreensis]|uniref:Uncharacterized protein n=1 Tax=Deinococcus koreensis TaxID=2054903 RepID=A0A2K3US92_9DEIO|nr:hypothetical protein CVO96_20005 [Deinococcus koreensis]